MAFKMPPGLLRNSMLSRVEAWRETRREVIKGKTEIGGGVFGSKNNFSCCCLCWGQKKNKVTSSIADSPFLSQVLQ